MKHRKMIGLAAAAAMIFMAIGAGTASATKFCEENRESGCIQDVLSGTNLKFEAAGTTTFTGPFGEVINKCGKSVMEAPTSNTGSSTETVKASIKSLSYSECEHPTTVVNTSGSITLGTIEFHKIAGTKNSTVTSTDKTFTIHNTLFCGTSHFLTNNTDYGVLYGKDDPSNPNPGTPWLVTKAKIASENCGFTLTLEGALKYTGTTPFNVSEN